MHHWFLTIRCKHEGGTHTILIIDSLGNKTAKRRISSIKGKLKNMNLIGKKDKCVALNTVEQRDAEYGIRMAVYMVFFRNLNVQLLRTAEIIKLIREYVASERAIKELAAHRRKSIHRLLENEKKLI